MRSIGRNKYWRAGICRLPACVALVAYLVAALGVPLPAMARKDTSQPFPCQNNPCGCRTAEECWTHCACYTAEERWAWAREHNVEPPAYAERPADDGWNDAPKREQEEGNRPAHGRRCSCCESTDGCEETSPPPSGRETASVIGVAALHCHGLSTLWVAAGAVLPPPPLAWSPRLTASERIDSEDVFAVRLPSLPLDPPPRLSLS
jgi:hypothetical protein